MFLSSRLTDDAIRQLALEAAKFGESAENTAEAFAIFTRETIQFLAEREFLLHSVASKRQWYLYTKGKPQVSKKWENALLRKARIAEKRRNSRG